MGFGVRSFGPSLVLWEKSKPLRNSVDADILTFLFVVFTVGLRPWERNKGNLLVFLSAAVKRPGFALFISYWCFVIIVLDCDRSALRTPSSDVHCETQTAGSIKV
jgi:hypothetical protein